MNNVALMIGLITGLGLGVISLWGIALSSNVVAMEELLLVYAVI